MKQVKEMLCPMCLEGKLEWKPVNNTHIYICDVCPFIAFEYIDNQNLEDLTRYLKLNN